ncbi:roadblock/LC7 domain-containing protein [Pseudonocardia sp. KRD-169]|uniref:Roadblock/LC7 domain-containing protein n=1 Tax=Pseudonocardia abyssalis TaxID=2792008 RepID=A0ABS6V157_9PSEU|nr:roadblock/LC7 domain-containing protein [Pseudonocardia abyssalis]MBW0117906.1 roadblock/LC7 domain-containing protein [Pseudonocardia abyssalis]MBW0138243.1 roadblock/LC7 domain-containing protein [Pseudonocardia abyssalis]
MLEEFVGSTPGVVHGVLVSADGLRLATSAHVGVALGDQLSAAASGLVSLARGTAHLLAAGPVAQTILEMAGGYLFVTSISHGATLSVFAERQCDIGMVGYEMTLLAARAGHALTPAMRSAGT